MVSFAGKTLVDSVKKLSTGGKTRQSSSYCIFAGPVGAVVVVPAVKHAAAHLNPERLLLCNDGNMIFLYQLNLRFAV